MKNSDLNLRKLNWHIVGGYSASNQDYGYFMVFWEKNEPPYRIKQSHSIRAKYPRQSEQFGPIEVEDVPFDTSKESLFDLCKEILIKNMSGKDISSRILL
ncbi:hypothetical protein J4216_04895 [Candidatus Woesearchaeota archaeon]|nr:hypothetical protein [Candidatus Woesearchaeota archaeon]